MSQNQDIPTITFKQGVDYDDIKIEDGEIRIIGATTQMAYAVAAPWAHLRQHGYDPEASSTTK